MKFAKGKFDVVISLTAIQNFSNIEKGLLNMKKTGKRFIFTFLKKSDKREFIEDMIDTYFSVVSRMECEKDVVYFCE